MSKSIFIGMEASNGYVKATSNITKGEVDTYLNTLTPVSEDVYNASQSEDSLEEVYSIQLPLETETQYYKVNKTITSDEQIFFSDDDKSKYTSDEWIMANLIAVYRQIQSTDFAGVNMYLVTGLPTNHSKDENLKKEIKRVLTKSYTVNGKIVRIHDVSIIPQGDASFFNDLITVEGEFDPEFLKETTPDDEDQQSTLLYFDIGFGTTDVKTVIDYAIVPTKSKELPGMEAQWVKVMDKAIEENPELAGIEILGVEKQLRSGGEIDINKEKANVSLDRDKILLAFAKQLVGTIGKAPFKGMLIDQIRFVGGGTIVMEPYIKEVLKDKYKDNPEHIKKFKFIKNSQATNALGFYKMCLKKYNQ
ncbi:hypothetical protein [Priestia koreensis]|uniref:ParM/StbA family protein n=1 Tax=Priestia koreensis TaxID=284581 RepID=UPI00203F4C95|nr:hypothetical protein [Priestia koreensis]MCM3005690.1 hypothetical protein [Priestia koreensis]